jgi:putative PEP-CTERM system histidine kinase
MELIWLPVGAATYAVILAAVVLRRAPRHPAHVSFAIGMTLLAAEAVLAALAWQDRSTESGLAWQRFRLLLSAVLPAPWLIFSRTYSRGDASIVLHQSRHWFAASLLPLGIAILGYDHLVLPPPTDLALLGVGPSLGWIGFLVELWLLLTAVAILTQLERTFRSAVGVMRWRVKYLVLGVGVMFGFRLYSASQAVLHATPEDALGRAVAVAIGIGCILITIGLTRGTVFDVDVYPSQSLVYGSLTVVIAGAYLLIVGVLSHLVSQLGGSDTFALQAFLILVGLVGLAILLLSERLRQRVRQWVSRHLRRPEHDYRRIWNTFTRDTTSLMEEDAFCRAVASWLSTTFHALSANVWLVEDSGERLRLGGSTALDDDAAHRLHLPDDAVRSALQSVAELREPTIIVPGKHPWAATLQQLHPGVFPEGGSPVCQPLLASNRLLGILILGDRVSGAAFSTEDLDLLKCVGDQVAANLLGLQLSAQLVRNKELEAFQAMSAFFVHDLKNTASTLSLTLQNLHRHFADPAFRDDALRAVSKSVEHLNHLIARLTRLRQELNATPQPTDLAQLVSQTLDSLNPSSNQQALTRDLHPVPPVSLDPEQFQKVIVNLILNAREAIAANGQIQVRLRPRPPWAVLEVIDNGCGMSPQFIRESLFRPFQTTKRNGLGIGMFHSKMIVEAQKGRLEVESNPGSGTTLRVLLPLSLP